jgi:hypothetical protein
MSLTANFDFCVELGIAPVKAIFHLALKNENLFPHNVGPFKRTYSGVNMTISVKLLDDHDSPADLSLQDDKHIRFVLPIEIDVQIPDAPDPTLSQVTVRSSVSVPGALATWTDQGNDQLGVDFSGVDASQVQVPSVDGLPALDATRFANAIHQAYDHLASHTFTLGPNTLVLYDDTRDVTLSPPNKSGDPQITAAIENHGAKQFLRVVMPIYADVPQAMFHEYGTVTFWREIVQTDTSVSVDMASEPSDPALATVIDFDGSNPAESIVISNLKPLVIGQLGGFGTITEPWFTETSAKTVIAQETAAYLADKRYPMYTPQSGDPNITLSTPVGFLLPAANVLAILMNRRSGTAMDDQAPDDFTGGQELALAVGRGKLDDMIQAAILKTFPGIENGSSDIHTSQGDATLHSITVTPSDPTDHGQNEGHLWAEGEAEVHIDCWPDPDVSFAGPIFLRVSVTEDPQTCTMTVNPVAGDFDVDESCCSVFLDLLIPVVGLIMLVVIENTINEVGGELATDLAAKQAQQIQAVPPVVVGVAELQSCLEGLNVSSQGLVFPGKLRVRRDGTSFEDLDASGNLPRP